jgi:hypothetical protein
MTHHNQHTTEMAATIGGTVLAATSIPDGASFASTIILALTGAVTSFIATALIKRIWKKITKRND